ncbi:hypothetical protein NEHOM01_2197 [Nematocida homosporus]|uniref:uncharacterized protein n=1 Tax=Nematocida homosporus TaxID=1912981 RepID=UPI0022210638|nr:uncharacterized protein NEHOM01_2197 [Nematocida homosporus]KAI5187464.1 hypothetical protein NEHOM01_2197 [Nematocida homosporus]
MENLVVNAVHCKRQKCFGVSNGWMLGVNGEIEPIDNKTDCKMPKRYSENPEKALGFFAESNGRAFRVLTRDGAVWELDCASSDEWEKAGEFEDDQILGCQFNADNGNLLVGTHERLFLIDKNMNLIGDKEIPERISLEIKSQTNPTMRAAWSPDGKYICVQLGFDVIFYGYDLSVIADTLSMCNKVMNSRLMRTKKYLKHESAYVDVVRRVEMPDDQLEYVDDLRERESVLFEDRTKYKLCAWHDQFSLAYAVSENNTIFLLERNGLKFKEIQHIRKSDQKAEEIEDNQILQITSTADYLYIIHQEKTRHFMKVYYIKNNCIYLKTHLCLETALGVEQVSTIYAFFVDPQSQRIHVSLAEGHLIISQHHLTNRTTTDVIDVDGCRLLFYNLAKCTAPPPIFARHLVLKEIPAAISCTARYIEITNQTGQQYQLPTTPLQPSQPQAKNLEQNLAALTITNLPPTPATHSIPSSDQSSQIHTEITGLAEQQVVPFYQSTAKLSLTQSKLTLSYQDQHITVHDVTSAAVATLDTSSLLITKSGFSATEIHQVNYCPTSKTLNTTLLMKTEKNSRLIFVAPTHVVLINRYGMLETFYLQVMVVYWMRKYAAVGSLDQAVTLGKKHGVPLTEILPDVEKAIAQQKLSPSLALEVTKSLLASPQTPTATLQTIEQYLNSQLQYNQLAIPKENKENQIVSQPTPLTARDITYLTAALVEIYLFQRLPAQIIQLAHHYAPNPSSFTPNSALATSKYPIALSIMQRATAVLDKKELIKVAMDQYAYLLCYLILAVTNSFQDEVNDILLAPNQATINPSHPQEEIARRLRIANYLNNRKIQTRYHILNILNSDINNADTNSDINNADATNSNTNNADTTTPTHTTPTHTTTNLTTLANTIKAALESARIRDYYLYLAEETQLLPQYSFTQISPTKYARVVAHLLTIAGDDLVKENSPEEALACYTAAGSHGKLQADNLRLQLGRWQELFQDTSNITPNHISRLEAILTQKKELASLADMHLQYGHYDTGLHLLVQLSQYQTLLAQIQTKLPHSPTALLSLLTTNTTSLTETLASLAPKYTEHTERLNQVRTRKEAQRQEIQNGLYADDDCETTAYTRSFITNTFITSTTNSTRKKKRSAKLRNTVGGRYEEEYVQYVLSELILKAISLLTSFLDLTATIDYLTSQISTTPTTTSINSTSALTTFQTTLLHFVNTFLPTYPTDFISQNTEDDPLYDPDRPLIPQPDISPLLNYLNLTQ